MRKSLSLFCLIAMFLFSCKEDEEIIVAEQTPEFAFTDEYYAINEHIHIDSVGEAYSYLWDLGNGSISTEKHPYPLTYTKPGIYTIKLTTTKNGKKSTTSRQLKVGQYFAYEVQLSDYVDNYALEGGNHLEASEGNPDVYLKIHKPTSENGAEIIYKSDVKPTVTHNSLPLKWSINPVPLVGKAPELIYGFTPIFDFYDANTDKEDRLIATTQVSNGAGSVRYLFDKKKNEGEYFYTRYVNYGAQVGKVTIKFRIQLP